MLKKIEQYIPIMPPDLALWLTLISLNQLCIKHIPGSKGVRATEVLLY